MTAIKELKAVARARAGKGAARAERRAGRVPAVIYGEKQDPVTISLDFIEVNKAIYAGHFLTTLFEVDVDGTKHRVIPRDYQMDPVKDFPLHVDFLRVSKGTTLTVEVPVHFVNQDASPALKAGGTLNVVAHSVELEAPADAIPEAVVVDLTGAAFGDIFHLSKVKLPAGVTWAGHGDDTLATVVAPTVSAEPAAEAPAAEEPKA
ncbi:MULTISPECIES: 50S ribosomal protein L25/general stress protein Ctc [unclassified Xanthobacter]|uniref:50S ribosomal protein L25/general stress protein Ctc n=1 Tax=unclassified Xanthobacter TaxID=2623496 RepID=UPI001F297E17|nr:MULTISPECIES: 50S ribosomal protein L25/general stress protein Ctc [unclassified Xanthobacter]